MKDLAIEKLQEFDNHQVLSFIYDPKTELRGFIAIHRGGVTDPALGATRLWEYESEEEAIKDALRLSRLMSYKSALAGIKYGGAKAVLIASRGVPRNRKEFFRAYAQKINYFRGKFITGTDVGVNDEDIKTMRRETPYVIGTRVDSAYFTAVGVLYGIQAGLEQVFGSGKLKGRSFAIQGIGKVGYNILELLYKNTRKIFIADVDEKCVKEVRKKFPAIKIVSPSVIHKQPVDVFVPCAMSGILNSESVLELRCKIVAGAANNQLESSYIGDLLYKLGILYVPDYAINSGGLIAVVEELEHEVPNQKRILARIEQIKKTLKTIFKRSDKYKCATSTIADKMAEKIFNNHF